MNNQDTLYIAGMEVVDFKGIELVNIKIDKKAGLVTIGGENGQGKSSLLDAMEAALESIKDTKSLIRHGASEFDVKVRVNGDGTMPFTVHRHTKAGVPQLEIIYDGTDAVKPRPSEFLKELIDGGFADPMEFIDAQPIEQRRILLALANVDVDSIDSEITEATREMKRLEERQKALQHKVEDLPRHEDVGTEELKIGDLATKMQEAAAHNEAVARLRRAADSVDLGLEKIQNDRTAKMERIQAMKDRLAQEEASLAELDAELKTATDAGAQVKADAAKATDIDTKAIEEEIAGIEETNRKVRENKARAAAREEWIAAEKEVGAANDTIESLKGKKKLLLANASFPVEGIGFDTSCATFNDIPLKNCSDAEQIMVGVAISMAQRGRLSPIRIKRASTLDAHKLAHFDEEGKRHGVQVFAEIVTNRLEAGYDRQCNFYVREGRIDDLKLMEDGS